MDDVAEALAAARSVLKTHIRQTRNVLQFLADLDEKLEAYESQRTAEEAQRNGNNRERVGV